MAVVWFHGKRSEKIMAAQFDLKNYAALGEVGL